MDAKNSIFPFHEGIELDSWGAESVHLEMNGLQFDEIDVAIDAPIESEIRGLGIDTFVWGVVHADGEFVLPLLKKFADFDPETGIPALMNKDLPRIQIDDRGRIDGIELQEKLLAFLEGWRNEIFEVPVSGADVIAAAVLSILRIPSMGD